ncbi:MAG: lytic transglycosylase F [Desulfobacteraceae bacterium 4572_123]|nr:MAG: lytic transglycosylase F [Desulfobacteraceae bacterium 4572_123]
MFSKIFLKNSSGPLRHTRFSLAVLVLLFCLSGCSKPQEPDTYDRILKTGEITVITRNNAHCYYIYRGQPMGFEYDLAKAFADDLGVKLNIKIAENWDGMLPALRKKTGDLVAASMTITKKRRRLVDFSNGYMIIQQHIIIHRDNHAIKRVEDLAGKTIHVRRGTSYEDRLRALMRQGIGLRISVCEDSATEELIRLVAAKDIDITIADNNIAFLSRRYYPETTVGVPINEKEYLGWAVRPGDGRLLELVNQFFAKIKQNGVFTDLYNKYYADIDDFDYVDLRAFHRRVETRLPRYSQIIKDLSLKNDFDWRVIAAQIYQESHFNPKAQSHAGAFGLMQLTRSTAAGMGVKNLLDPAENIGAGIRHLKKLYDFFDKARDPDRLFIALAAYNIGQGHILDARNLARQMGISPNMWASLKKTLPLLRQRKYYKKSKYGYCRGNEPIEYIKQIMLYYDILKRQGIEFASDNSPLHKDVEEQVEKREE